VLEDHIVPRLKELFPDAEPLDERVLVAQGIGESDIVTRLENENLQCPEISMGFYPGQGRVEIRLSVSKEKAALLNKAESALRELLRDHLIN